MTLPGTETAAPTLVPFDSFGSFSTLYADYCARFGRVASFYARDWTSAADRRAAVVEAAGVPRERETLVRVLREQQPTWGPDDAALRSVERLSDPSSAVVVTGQQVGLFTGPMYTVLKAMTTVLLARRLEEETGRPVIPVFWLGSEDHDLDEMAGVGVPEGDGVLDLRYTGHVLPPGGNLGSVGPLPFDPSVAEVVDRLDTLLPPSDFHDDLVRAVREAYAPGMSFRDAFGRLLRRMLPDQGLVLMSADHPELKRLSLPLWMKEIRDGEGLMAGLGEATARLESTYHAQVHVSPTNLFVMHEGSRLPIDLEGGRYRVRGTDQAWSRDELLRLMESETGRFSPNVVMRPLTQDLLLPTAAYVGGPGEVAYFAQYRDAYEWAGLPMPVIWPRASVTLVERRVRRSMDRLGRGIPDFSGDVEALFSELVLEQLDFDLEARFDEAAGHLDQAVTGLKETLTEVDPSLEKTVEATRAALLKEMERLRERVVRSERRRQEDLRAHVDKVAGALFPGGGFQERVVTPLWFLNKYGPDFFVRLMEQIDVGSGRHQVVDL
jgi:bacillithiol biosynthesis cysteine-adding enzyme BshC